MLNLTRQRLLGAAAFTAFLSLSLATSSLAGGRSVSEIRVKLADPTAGIFVAAHRGCHNADPARGLGEAPENSITALEHCVALDVDMMELDVRRTRDGALVVLHDETVDRTTDGTGRIDAKTLTEIKTLHLRQNMGGNMSPTLTSETVPTLAEILDAGKGRIMFNLDIKDDVYPEVIALVKAKGLTQAVLVKRSSERVEPPLADNPLFTGIPFMPIIGHWPAMAANTDYTKLAQAQLRGQHRIEGLEIVYLTEAQFKPVAQTVKAAKVRLWANTLTSVGVISVIGKGGDLEALRSGGKNWSSLLSAGFDTFQTDEPGPLIDMLREQGMKY